MKYSIFTVCAKDMAPEQLLARMKHYGYDGVEWRVTEPATGEAAKQPYSYWKNNLCTVDSATILKEADKLKALCADYGIEMCSLGTYAGCEKYDTAAYLLEAAAKLGCPKIRVGTPYYDDSMKYGEMFFACQTAYEKLVPVAKRFGVQMLIEMHPNTLAPSASAARRLVGPFDPAALGVIYDVGNLVNEGYEHYRLGLETLGPYLSHVHVKNSMLVPDGRYDDGGAKFASKNTPMWDGVAAFAKFRDALKAVGYDGYLSIEDFCDDLTTEEKLKQDIAYLKKVFE